MRFTAFIMAIIILILCSLPCADVYSQTNAPASEHSQSIPQSQHEDHQDLCSPFCYCCCCSTVAITPQLTTSVFSNHVNIPASVYSEYLQATVIDIYLPIWQPPKV